ncbi:thioesterase family protein [Sporosarcina sp. HYO08]|uniref:thioesterase family protein n=1 Tax=Sporosarcina sp. HYO08 TaxID=1759557 RepID=UPI000792CB74|nr:thioesterase family protein [Sporosarcina sp. HYO08]KXH78573.1 3-hydroxyacyl-CoA dehydrogenase [Sporosarcina sp. HYO08]
MSIIQNPILQEKVRTDWVDYNGHMNDAAYAAVFSMAVDQFMIDLGIDAPFREQFQYSIFTLETHLCYLDEAHEGQLLKVNLQLLDADEKRLHVFFIMEDTNGNRIATSEQMLMGMNLAGGRPAPFPAPIQKNVTDLQGMHANWTMPKEVGRRIGIRKK